MRWCLLIKERHEAPIDPKSGSKHNIHHVHITWIEKVWLKRSWIIPLRIEKTCPLSVDRSVKCLWECEDVSHLLWDWRRVRAEPASEASSSTALQGKRSTSLLDRSSYMGEAWIPERYLQREWQCGPVCSMFVCLNLIDKTLTAEAYTPTTTAATVNSTKAFFLRKAWMSSLEISSTFLFAFMVRMWMPSLSRCILLQWTQICWLVQIECVSTYHHTWRRNIQLNFCAKMCKLCNLKFV